MLKIDQKKIRRASFTMDGDLPYILAHLLGRNTGSDIHQAFDNHNIHTITNVMLRKELSAHKHQMSRMGKSAKDMRKELLDHYFQNYRNKIRNLPSLALWQLDTLL